MILIISGTNHTHSISHVVARYYSRKLAGLTLPCEVLSLEDLPHNFLFSDLYGERSPEFLPTEEKMRAADFFLFVVPEYNGSFPGVLKVFLDALDPEKIFHGKRAALVGVSSGKFGNLRGLDHLTGVLNYLRVEVMPFRAHLMQIGGKLDSVGNLQSPHAVAEVEAQLAHLVRFYLPTRNPIL